MVAVVLSFMVVALTVVVKTVGRKLCLGVVVWVVMAKALVAAVAAVEDTKGQRFDLFYDRPKAPQAEMCLVPYVKDGET